MDRASAAPTTLDIPVWFVHQTASFAPATQLGSQRSITVVSAATVLSSELARGIDHFEFLIGSRVIATRQSVDDTDSPIFADVPHTNEAGAAIAARTIWDALGSDIAGVAFRSPRDGAR